MNKKRKYHWLEIGIHLLTWLLILWFTLDGGWIWLYFKTFDASMDIPIWYGMIFNAIIFYANAFWLLPIKFDKGRKFHYWKIATTIFIILTGIETAIDVLYADWLFIFELPFLFVFLIFIGYNALFHIGFWILAFAYYAPKAWLRNERQKQELIQQKLRAELAFLKAQINPHFLFNGINSIYHLIVKDPHQAQQTLYQFSSLLRYQLYECNEPTIPLQQELEYLENYIALENVRKGRDAAIQWSIDQLESSTGMKIAPLLITPFIENAFKYLSNYLEKERNIVDIKIQIQKNSLNLEVENTYEEDVFFQKDTKAGGIGLENVKRRLKLIYPDKHNLVMLAQNGKFIVHLKLVLT